MLELLFGFVVFNGALAYVVHRVWGEGGMVDQWEARKAKALKDAAWERHVMSDDSSLRSIKGNDNVVVGGGSGPQRIEGDNNIMVGGSVHIQIKRKP